MQTDNTTTVGVVNTNIQPKRTKAMDMRFHWLRCRKTKKQFHFFWHPRPTNKADYWTKHHCAAHHIEKRHKILTHKSVLDTLRASLQHTPIPVMPLKQTPTPFQVAAAHA
jgi:hypothetical protein